MKLYGVHDSYCALVTPNPDSAGELIFCNCESGKKQDMLAHKRELWEGRAREYATGMVDDILKQCESKPTQRRIEAMHAFFVSLWKEGHSFTPEPAPEAPPEATEDTEFTLPAPGTEGPGEEDGPWAVGWQGRVSHDGVALNSVSHPVPKSDFGKPKPYTYFIQQFPLGFRAVAQHMEKGCQDPGHVFLGWQDVENGYERYTDAMARHLLEEVLCVVTDIDREGVDKGWIEERQAIAVAANAMIRLELLLRKRRNLNLDARSEA